ncbi:Gluconokinase [Thalictrum thalictroides]|uniref:Gluconokinase n=1 Tax=Thalictrum thalictroides TaxID=46969 RepID=A0A7J6WMW9_THATH|nr:Gluconokinase [Thalictrum thalictroides]
MVSSPDCSDSIKNNNSEDDDVAPLAIVIMGVSGSGKSTVGNMLAKNKGCSFLDADDFHPNANKEKMSKGIPLSDEDRIPWLERLSDLLRENIVNCKTVILGCSALQNKYREILRVADPSYKSGSYGSCRVRFVCLEAPVEVIAARLEKRAEEGNHFMSAKLLQSQLDLLQIGDAEGILMVDATLSPQAIVNNVRDLLLHPSGK